MMAGEADREHRTRVIAIVAILISLTAIALEIAYTIGAYVLDVVHQIP